MDPFIDRLLNSSRSRFTRRQAIRRIGGVLSAAAVARPMIRGGMTHSGTVTGDGSPGSVEIDSRQSRVPLPNGGLPRSLHTVTPLRDGTVLIAGGEVERPLGSAEIFDPLENLWWQAGSLNIPRTGHAAAILPDGRVMVAGGRFESPLSSVEIYDPSVDLWSLAAPLSGPRFGHAAAALPSGHIVISGGRSAGALSCTEVYDPFSERWTAL